MVLVVIAACMQEDAIAANVYFFRAGNCSLFHCARVELSHGVRSKSERKSDLFEQKSVHEDDDDDVEVFNGDS